MGVDARRTLLDASIARAQAEARRLIDTVALFVGLVKGGRGWERATLSMTERVSRASPPRFIASRRWGALIINAK
jgi:hypothetical protein